MSQNNLNIGTKELGAIASEEDDPEEYIGYLNFSTTGEVIAPRDWLQEQWDELGLPDKYFPSEVSNWQAYRRTINYLQDDTELLNYTVANDEYQREFNCHLEIEKSEDGGSNVFIVHAKTFMPEEIVGVEGGDWSEERIGHFNFFRPEDGDGWLVHEAEIEESNAHYNALENLFDTSREVMQMMKSHHIYQDMHNVLKQFRSDYQAVRVRRSVYFIGAHGEDVLDGLATLWDRMQRFKDSGEDIRIDKTPVINMEDQRELVAERVREKVQEMVDNVVGEIITEFEEADDQTADEAANALLEELEETKDISSTYNELLNMRLSVKEVLEEQRKDLNEESDEIIENVLDQQTFEDIEVL